MKQLLIILLLCGAVNAFGQQTDFSGAWLIGGGKPEFNYGPYDVFPKNMEVMQDSGRMYIKSNLVSADSAVSSYTEVLPFNGAASQLSGNSGMKKSSSLKWNKDGRTFELFSETLTPEGQPGPKLEDHWSLENGGKILAIDRFVTYDKPLHGYPATMHYIAVYFRN